MNWNTVWLLVLATVMIAGVVIAGVLISAHALTQQEIKTFNNAREIILAL